MICPHSDVSLRALRDAHTPQRLPRVDCVCVLLAGEWDRVWLATGRKCHRQQGLQSEGSFQAVCRFGEVGAHQVDLSRC